MKYLKLIGIDIAWIVLCILTSFPFVPKMQALLLENPDSLEVVRTLTPWFGICLLLFYFAYLAKAKILQNFGWKAAVVGVLTIAGFFVMAIIVSTIYAAYVVSQFEFVKFIMIVSIALYSYLALLLQKQTFSFKYFLVYLVIIILIGFFPVVSYPLYLLINNLFLTIDLNTDLRKNIPWLHQNTRRTLKKR